MPGELFSMLSREAERVVSLPAGGVLFRAEDPVSAIFLVEEGSVLLQRVDARGAGLILQRAKAGDILAEASIFSPNYHCDGLVRDACRLRILSLKGFRRLEQDQPGTRVLLAAYLAERLQTARTQTAILSLRTVAERLDAWLSERGNPIPDKGQWRDLAEVLAVSPEALYRELAKRRRGPRQA